MAVYKDKWNGYDGTWRVACYYKDWKGIERRIVRRWIIHLICRWTKSYQTVRSHCWPVDRRTDCSRLLLGAN